MNKKIITDLSELTAHEYEAEQNLGLSEQSGNQENQESLISQDESSSSVFSRRRFLQNFATMCALSTVPSFVLAGEIPKFQNTPSPAPSGAPSPNPSSPSSYAPVSPSNDFWSRPRVVNIKRWQNNERLQVSYWKNGKIDMDGYRRICWLMRDLRGGNAMRSIDPRLLDLICAMQAWVGHYGYTKPFQISSGYRSPATNARTEGAAKNSMHMQGRAADIIIPELPVNYLGRLAQHYSAGGVGFYPSRGFVHVDTGNIRSWRK